MKPSRNYTSVRRQQQAAQTRADVLDAAVRLFAEHGWSGSTLAMIAGEAGVAVETVYSTFGSKKRLLRAAMDVAVVGDAEPVAFADRPETAVLDRGTLEQRVKGGVRLNADVVARSLGVWQAILEAATGDPEVEAWRADLEAGRRVEVERSLRRIVGKPVPATIVDIAFVILGPDAYRSFTVDLHYERAAYETRVSAAIVRLLAGKG
jgi:AcrR family transcriptional regulator